MPRVAGSGHTSMGMRPWTQAAAATTDGRSVDREPASAFELIERITPEALARHPAWTHFEPDLDHDRLIAWGVTVEQIERQEAAFVACGLIPLYPVLDPSSLEDRTDVTLAARFEPEGGPTLAGYLLDPHAFGVFVSGHEFSFNRNLRDFSAREAVRLARALGRSPEQLFPLTWQLDERLRKLPGDHEGVLRPFW